MSQHISLSYHGHSGFLRVCNAEFSHFEGSDFHSQKYFWACVYIGNQYVGPVYMNFRNAGIWFTDNSKIQISEYNRIDVSIKTIVSHVRQALIAYFNALETTETEIRENLDECQRFIKTYDNVYTLPRDSEIFPLSLETPSGSSKLVMKENRDKICMYLYNYKQSQRKAEQITVSSVESHTEITAPTKNKRHFLKTIFLGIYAFFSSSLTFLGVFH